MQKLSQTDKYSVREIAKELNLTTIVENGIRNNFGDPISIKNLAPLRSAIGMLECWNNGIMGFGILG